MRKFRAVGLFLLLFAFIAAGLFAAFSLLLGTNNGNPSPAINTSPPGDSPTLQSIEGTLPPIFNIPSGGGGGSPLNQVDHVLQTSMRGSLAYNAPPDMNVNETVRVHLVLSPNLSEEELKKVISEPGTVFSSGDVKLTDKMEAKLIPADPDAFTIQPLQEPRQLITNTEPTDWNWQVTAKKSGRQKLALVVYRVIEYQGEELSRVVREFESDIEVRVSPQSQMRWAGVLLVLLLGALAGGWVWVRKRSREAVRAPGRASHPRRPSRGSESQGHVFLSYRRSDSADITGRIYDSLVAEFGREPIFKDVDSIPLGVDFKQYLDLKVGECRALLAIIGSEWTEARDAHGERRLDDPDDFVRIEIESALERGIPVIPLLVRGAQMPVAENLPPSLRKLVFHNGMPIRPDPDFHHDMERLTAALDQYI